MLKHAVVIFSKVPQEGVSKTRLTERRGGILTDAEANEFYEAFLADVIHACSGIKADLYLCHNAAGDRTYLDAYLKRISAPVDMKIFHDKGGTFDECMQFASDYILQNGKHGRLADTVTLIGGDLPTLQRATVNEVLDSLDTLSETPAGKAAALDITSANGVGAALVEGACQEGGFSIIAFTCTTPFDFHGVFYNADGVTALDMAVEKAVDKNIPLGIVEQVPDVDIPLDMAGMIPNVFAYEVAAKTSSKYNAPKFTVAAVRKSGLMSTAMPPAR